MPEEKNSSKKKTSIDWLMRGVLTKIGDTFDRLTGRRRVASSSLATSELSEKLKKLLDLEVKDFGAKGKFVPHNIKLKMQWDKFSTDSESALQKLESELKIAAIDHINDNSYHTYAPIKLEVTPDYFTEGVKMLVNFDKFDDEKREVSVNVTVPQIKVGDYMPLLPEIKPTEEVETFIVGFTLNGKSKQLPLTFKDRQRRSVGRTKENDLSLEDSSVSKIHAALVLNSEKQLMVADTGSTNGTFINDKRIAYGRAFPIANDDCVKFGNIEVSFEYVPGAVENVESEEVSANYVPNETFSASQNDIHTVAFSSNEDISLSTKLIPPPIRSENIQPKENVAEANLAEEKFVEIKPEVKVKVEPSANASGTHDRINYEFPNED
ncbi:MAG: FHA domain-containing protein [Actinomycetota bacterium]